MSAQEVSRERNVNTFTDAVIVSILGINYLILLPIFIQCVRILYKHNKIQVFRSRRPLSLQYQVVLTFIVFALIQPYRLFDGSIPFFIPSFINNAIEYSLTLALLLCYCQRAYLLHYDFNYHEAILNKEWKQFTSLHQSSLDWFLTHRNSFGNRTFTLFIIIIIWLLLTAALTAAAFHFQIESHWIMIQLLLFASMEIFILKLILSMPGVDVFRIRDEYTYLLAVGLMFIAVIVCLLIFYDDQNVYQVIIFRFVYHSTTMIGTVAMCALSIIYPYRVHIECENDCKDKNKPLSPQIVPNKSPAGSPKLSPRLSPITAAKTLTEMLDMTAIAGGMSLSRHNSNNNIRVSLEELMKYLVGIEAFLDHLVKELSAENVFFLSDICQYKHAFVSDGLMDQVFGWNMELPDDIPKSHILQQPDHYLRSLMILNKYIRANSELEINISWATRHQIVTAFDELDSITKPDPIIMITRFDFAAEEIRKLLADSFRRFCLTPQYKKFCRDYNTRTRRIQRKLSSTFRSVTRELSRDRSHSTRDHHYDHHSPVGHPHAMKRLASFEKRGKLSDINEYSSHIKRAIIESKENDDTHNILPPMSLSMHQDPTPSNNALELPPIDANLDISGSYSSSPSNENQERLRISEQQPNQSGTASTNSSGHKQVNILTVLGKPAPILTEPTSSVTPLPTVTPFEQEETPADEQDTPLDEMQTERT